MAKEQSRRRQSHASRISNESRVPAWVWLFTGAVLGAFVMFLFRLSELEPADTSASAARNPKNTSKATDKKNETPRFDFYEMLKENTVAVPDFPEASDNPQSAEEDVKYSLQVASFRNKKDAEQLRAELILLNLDAQTVKVKVRNGETWHRVLVGPFSSRSKLAKARSTLISNDHQALMLKHTQDG